MFEVTEYVVVDVDDELVLEPVVNVVFVVLVEEEVFVEVVKDVVLVVFVVLPKTRARRA